MFIFNSEIVKKNISKCCCMGEYKIVSLLPILAIIILGTIPAVYSESSEEYYMLTLINNERQLQGLEPLTMNSSLSSAARLHSQDMVNRNFFNHVNPDGQTPSDRARNAGYSFMALAENICGNPSIDAGHSSLMGSPTHRVNILNSSYKEVGIGIVDGGPYGKMITQLFGTQFGNSVTTPSSTSPQETQGKPDLNIERIDFSGQAEPLKQVSMKIILINSGNKNAGNFIFAVFEGPPEKGNQLGKVNISSLYAGQKITANFSWTPSAEGSYTLYFVTDYKNDINEENENNNVATYNLSVINPNSHTPSQDTSNAKTQQTTNKPDLYISKSDISYNQIVYEGTSSLISFRIRNIGKSTAFGVPVKIYVNGDLKSSSTINQLQPSSYNDLTLFLTFTNPGENYIEIRLDPDISIDEISRSNNDINFNIKVVPRESNSVTPHNNKLTSHDIDLLIYPYYITIEERDNESFLIKAKIKNKSDFSANDFSVTFYQKDSNSSNNIFIEKIYISLGPEEIVEENVTFIPIMGSGEIIVIIDEENSINEINKNNNLATKIFSKNDHSDNHKIQGKFIINTTPEDVNVSNSFKVTMKLRDINASNVFLYYRNEDTNNSFFILKMDGEFNNSYSIEVDPLGRTNILYYFEVDTGTDIIKSPSDSPNKLYSTNINYLKNVQEKKNPSLLDNIKKIFGVN